MRRALVVLLGAVAAATALAVPPAALAAPAWRDCDALVAERGGLTILPSGVLVGGFPESSRRGGWDPGASALFIGVRAGRCPAAWELLRDVLAAGDETTALGERGFRIVAVEPGVRVAGRATYEVHVRRGSVQVRYWRFGRRPELDHSLYRAGQWIDLYGSKTFGKCTAAWVIVPRGSAPVGVTAGHCTERDFIEDIPVLRGFAGHPASRLGTILNANPGGLDAAIFSLSSDWGVAQQVERGNRLPLTAIGWVRTRDQDPGDRACYAGRTSGADRCGRIVPRYDGTAKYAVCTNIHTEHGDSGGPVYTPGSGGRVRALGVLIQAAGRLTGGHGNMCYTPIEAVLDAFGATFPRGPLVRGPGIPQ